MHIITGSYTYITVLWSLFQGVFSGKYFPDSRDLENSGAAKNYRITARILLLNIGINPRRIMAEVSCVSTPRKQSSNRQINIL